MSRYNSGPSKGTMAVAAIGIIALIIALYAVVIGIGALILTWGWNLVAPTFGWVTLDFGAAYALLVVLAVVRTFLFGGGISVKKS